VKEIFYIDRLTKEKKRERVYGDVFVKLLYGKGWVSRLVGSFLLPVIATIPLCSKIYGWFQRSAISRWKIRPFIKKYHVDTAEFAEPISHFSSFNAFFTRALRSTARPLVEEADVAILPADARYLVFPEICATQQFWIKSRPFDLEALLQDASLASVYEQGSMAIARLAPVDYHRFHFPCYAVPERPRLIPGPLYSVNPMALKQNVAFLWENKRAITVLKTRHFERVACVAIGATYVGTIHLPLIPEKPYAKGEEMGYFAFGGSCLILLFEPQVIQFDRDLIEHSMNGLETRGLMGQSLGRNK
jgi:phosphatidylserine decarboxylase